MESRNPNIRDGFRVLRNQYSPPDDSTQLAAHIKRKVTICNLFLNYRMSIKDVAKTLDETYQHAVGILIEQGIIQERRRVSRAEEPKQQSLFGFRLKNPRSND